MVVNNLRNNHDLPKSVIIRNGQLHHTMPIVVFNFQNQFVSFAHTYRCSTLVSKKLLVIRQEPINNFLNRCVLWQKEHQIMRKLERLLHNLIKVRIDVVETVLCQKLIASTSPGWTQKHAVKFLASVTRNFELWNR